MNKRMARGTALTLLLVFFYVFAVFPLNHFVNGSTLFVQTSFATEETGITVSRNLYGVVKLKAPVEKSAYIGGFPVAMALYTDGVIVEEIAPVDTAFGKATPALQLDKGDFLIELNGEKVEKTGDIERILSDYSKTIGLNGGKDSGVKFSKGGLEDGVLSDDSCGNKQSDIFKLPQFPHYKMPPQPSQTGEFLQSNKARKPHVIVQDSFKKLVRKVRKDKKASLDICDNVSESTDAATEEGKGNNYVLRHNISDAADGSVLVTVIRGRDRKTFQLQPALEEFSGHLRLGLVVRDYILGIGMVSYVKEDGSFGALGHSISDSLAGRVPIRGGHIFNCEELSVVKGERGKPGEFRVKISSMKNPIGVVERNNDRGIFGTFNLGEANDIKSLISGFHTEERSGLTPIAPRRQVSVGGAYICTTVGGVTDCYKIDIIKAINQSSASDKGLVVRISDKRLIDKTGGIIQGMSGSPIIQNGMLAGVVTHVFVNDPTKGYGMYMDFMCE